MLKYVFIEYQVPVLISGIKFTKLNLLMNSLNNFYYQ